MLASLWISLRQKQSFIRPCPKPLRPRYLSTSHLDPSIVGLADVLAQRQPSFSMSSQNVSILSQPHEFYHCLLDMIRNARKRIFISSLYIGSEEKELVDALRSSLASNASLHVYLVLDLNRSTRPGPSSTAHLLLPLLRDYSDRVHVSLFRSPRLSGIMAKLVPPRFNEGWGTWHAKIYGADDNIMISGANLNQSYFTNRQDRYIHFTSQPLLAQYCFSFLQTVSRFSYKLLPPSTPSDDNYVIQWPDPHVHPHKFQSLAERALTDFQKSHLVPATLLPDVLAPPSEPDTTVEDDVVIFPVIQAGQFNIREEEHCLSLLFQHLASKGHPATFKPSIDLTSGYFGLYEPYQKLILNSSAACRIVAASPKANGFYGSRGISGRIPEGYTLLEQRFMNAVYATGRNWIENSEKHPGGDGVQLSQWERDGWTYHAKGIWLSPTPDEAPVLTLFGSTNLNSRSSHLDTELSFVMMASSNKLRNRLKEEVEALRQSVRPWEGNERKVRIGTRIIVGLVNGML